MYMMRHVFERKLVVLFLVVVGQILAPVMHPKETDQRYTVVALLVFVEMPEKKIDLTQLAERSIPYYHNH